MSPQACDFSNESVSFLQQGDERGRLAAVQATRMLDTPASERFDRLTRLVSRFFKVDIALISLMDADRQWFKSRIGMPLSETPRAIAFCDLTIQKNRVLVIEDAKNHVNFYNNPLVVGEPFITFYAGVPLIMPSGHAIGTLCIAHHESRQFDADDCAQLEDFSELVMSEITLQQHIGRRNEVTGLPNRHQLTDDLSDLCKLDPDSSRVLVLLDSMNIVDMRRMMRAVGTAAVEVKAREISDRLKLLVGDGGDLYNVSECRFGIILRDLEGVNLQVLVSKFVHGMREPFDAHGTLIDLQVYAGAGAFRLNEGEARDALRRASSALHQAETTERLIVWHKNELDVENQRTYALIRDLPSELAAGRLNLVYQPKFDFSSGKFNTVEALLRWNHSVFGFVSPAQFIPLIETTSLIHPLTEWVINQALKQQSKWQKDALDLAVAINVSVRNLENPRFVEMFFDRCNDNGISPTLVHIECTETATIKGSGAFESLKELQSRGVNIALDDFGVGYSNLASLKNLPINLIKIDKTLVDAIDCDALTLELFQSIVAMSKRLGYRVLAEGVETIKVLEIVKSSGCDGVQGYFLSKPLTADDLVKFIKKEINF
ncbi:MAG: sensor domain-containing phosphodiesterase [Proteobacteria bacterium]|nr:MAG: sensor domain-containing phosphodiesterase [Pseudomonadota bacterium]